MNHGIDETQIQNFLIPSEKHGYYTSTVKDINC